MNTRPRIIYLSGPMTGWPDNNRATFHRAAAALTRRGHTVLNPAVLPDGLAYEQYLAIDLAMVAQADTIALLPGWETSPGVARERLAATVRALDEFVLCHYCLAEDTRFTPRPQSAYCLRCIAEMPYT